MKPRYRLLRYLRTVALGLALGACAPAYIGGLYYGLCGDHAYEQAWLDRAIDHLRAMRESCDAPDLCDILDYTIRRYSRAGAWDVMVAPCVGVYPNGKTVGVNVPYCPGITIDPEVLSWPPEDGALIVVHEALHDYWPFFGHGHINAREEKLYELSCAIRRLHRSDVRQQVIEMTRPEVLTRRLHEEATILRRRSLHR